MLPADAYQCAGNSPWKIPANNFDALMVHILSTQVRTVKQKKLNQTLALQQLRQKGYTRNVAIQERMRTGGGGVTSMRTFVYNFF